MGKFYDHVQNVDLYPTQETKDYILYYHYATLAALIFFGMAMGNALGAYQIYYLDDGVLCAFTTIVLSIVCSLIYFTGMYRKLRWFELYVKNLQKID
uniref:Uncharacterized protein n=1 Tax=viral metagenome TaxID=1070528 RepID=A0A6C0CLZ4_9ZZZZ